MFTSIYVLNNRLHPGLRGEVGFRNLENDRRFSQAQVSVFLADCGLTVFVGLTRLRGDDPPHLTALLLC